jgi:hypothetical protein
MSASATEVFLEGLDPAQYPSPVPQLLDPEESRAARRILGRLVSSAGRLSEDPGLRQAGSDALAAAAEAAAAGRAGESKRMEEVGERLASALGRLRAAVASL